MDTKVVDEDSIDTEALQAQIDLSMSFAQSLVSSWMEPQKLPPRPRKRDLEKELSEYMKRPPRLGVGASIPEGHQNMSRETARLKGKLTVSGKRLRKDEDEAASAFARRTEDDDDEDESRAGAIKKKQKNDPFDITHCKKKKKHHAKNESEQETPKLSAGQSSFQNPSGDGRKPDYSRDGIPSPSTKQKPSEEEPFAQNEELPPLQRLALKEDKTNSAKPGSSLAVVTRHLSESDHRTGSTSPTSTLSNKTVPRNPIHAELLKRPLLNLTGPPANSDDDESDAAEAGVTQSPLTSPKKKRKRRKKKKHYPITDHSAVTSPAAPSGGLPSIQT